jgi:MFS family permease
MLIRTLGGLPKTARDNSTAFTPVYTSDAGIGPQVLKPAIDNAARQRVPRTVWLIGVVSLLTDVSAEMVASVLPLYLFTVLRLSPLEYGWVDGLFNGSAALVRLAFAHWADRTKQHKRFALAGYALSAVSRVGMFVAGLGGWVSVAVVMLLDRVGKGIRTAPRDAMIAQSSTSATMGASFGVHRALDAVGALAGPLLATALLLWLPGRFDAVFAASVVFAVAGLVVLVRWVRPGQPTAVDQGAAPPDTDGVHANSHANLRSLACAPFATLCVSCTLLAVFTVSDNMVYLGLQQRSGFDATYLPMLYVATATVFMLAAVPMGRLADRAGPMRVFVLAHAGLVALYASIGLGVWAAAWAVPASVLLMGLYYAATDGVVMALLARGLPAQVRATGMAVVTSLVSLARMAASVAFGWVWTDVSHERAMGVFAIGMLASLVLTLFAIRRWPWAGALATARA